MSEEIEKQSRIKETIIHHISCDHCGKLICSSEEYDDGWYHNPIKYNQSFNVQYRDWYVFEAELCDDCRRKFEDNVIKKLTELGFRKR